MDVSMSITGIEFRNPIILASGPLSTSKAALLRAENKGFGGVVTKSVTIGPSEGNPQPRWAFGKDYLVSSDGLPNKGYKAMAVDIEGAREAGIAIPIIASVAGTSPEEFAEMSLELEGKGANAIELNFGCPHRGTRTGRPKDEPIGRYWAQTPERSYHVVKAVKEVVKVPVWAKFSSEVVFANPQVLIEMQKAGVDAVVPTAMVPNAMAINLETGKPKLGNLKGTGALQGRAMKPLGIKCASELSRILRTPVIASGGVYSGLDVIEYSMVGVYGVEVLTAIMQKVSVHKMIAEIEAFMSENGYEKVEAFRGKALEHLP